MRELVSPFMPPSLYSKCGTLGFGKTKYDASTLCGPGTTLKKDKDVCIAAKSACSKHTELRAGKCTPSSSVCGANTSFRRGKCRPSTGVCGTGTALRDGKCMPVESVCGENTAFLDGKCVSTLDVTSDNASVCGKDTAFRDEKCVAVSSVCGANTAFSEGKCTIVSTVCGKDTAFSDGKCVSMIDGSNFCGQNTTFVKGKCIAVSSVCGDNTAFEDGKCVSTEETKYKRLEEHYIRLKSTLNTMCDSPGVELRNGKCVVKYVDAPGTQVNVSSGPGDKNQIAYDVPFMLASGKWQGVPRTIDMTFQCNNDQEREKLLKEGNKSGFVPKMNTHRRAYHTGNVSGLGGSSTGKAHKTVYAGRAMRSG